MPTSAWCDKGPSWPGWERGAGSGPLGRSTYAASGGAPHAVRWPGRHPVWEAVPGPTCSGPSGPSLSGQADAPPLGAPCLVSTPESLCGQGELDAGEVQGPLAQPRPGKGLKCPVHLLTVARPGASHAPASSLWPVLLSREMERVGRPLGTSPSGAGEVSHKG